MEQLRLMSKQILFLLVIEPSAFSPAIQIHLIQKTVNRDQSSFQFECTGRYQYFYHLVCINFQHNLLPCFVLLIFLSFPQSYVPVYIVSNIVSFTSKGQCEKKLSLVFIIPFSFVFFRNSLCLHHLFPYSYPFLQES